MAKKVSSSDHQGGKATRVRVHPSQSITRSFSPEVELDDMSIKTGQRAHAAVGLAGKKLRDTERMKTVAKRSGWESRYRNEALTEFESRRDWLIVEYWIARVFHDI